MAKTYKKSAQQWQKLFLEYSGEYDRRARQMSKSGGTMFYGKIKDITDFMQRYEMLQSDRKVRQLQGESVSGTIVQEMASRQRFKTSTVKGHKNQVNALKLDMNKLLDLLKAYGLKEKYNDIETWGPTKWMARLDTLLSDINDKMYEIEGDGYGVQAIIGEVFFGSL